MNINKLYSIFKQHPIVCTDSRKITQGAIFFALKGDNFNGNEFAKKAINEGCAFAVIDELKSLDEKFILVDDVLHTLQELAKYHREQLSIPVIGITGTNGKTTSKELISAILSTEKRCYATKGNLNNHIGVPLSVLEINHNHEIAIIEMGANHIGEIAALCKIAQPNLGVITNIGKAHLEGFGDLEGVIQAKTELYKYIKINVKGKIFVNEDDGLLVDLAYKFGFRDHFQWRNTMANQRHPSNIPDEVLTEKYQEEYNKMTTKAIEKEKSNSNFIGYSRDGLGVCGGISNLDGYIEWKPHIWTCFDGTPNMPKGWGETIHSNLIGDYQFDNIALAVTIGEYFQISYENWKKAIKDYTPTNNRSEIIKTKNNILILDAYNANPSSMKAMLTSFSKQDNENKLCILGDMLELGGYSEKEHQEITSLCKSLNLNCYFIGEEFQKVNNDAFKNRQDFEEQIQKETIKGKTILLKGSRGIGLEKLVEYL